MVLKAGHFLGLLQLVKPHHPGAGNGLHVGPLAVISRVVPAAGEILAFAEVGLKRSVLHMSSIVLEPSDRIIDSGPATNKVKAAERIFEEAIENIIFDLEMNGFQAIH